jgi:hypothetical protein
LRNRDPQRLGGLQVDRELELGWLLDRQVARLGALQDLVDVAGGAPIHLHGVGAVRHQPAGLDDQAGVVARGDAVAGRQAREFRAHGSEQRAGLKHGGGFVPVSRLGTHATMPGFLDAGKDFR